ncbi:MAG: 50S ribosomal protein L29 [Candidatus Sungbacteria bacterium]|uniref:Large ribosomal subunit protein uL29 n=1 Tax=Candidatus Sungiibacteriota bacterium TaxID=2750080 RepID=A0A932YXJ7_9BACT|nr:50S ribosomal protein L29 [Candidatus Sungbacteria bacterium]
MKALELRKQAKSELTDLLRERLLRREEFASFLRQKKVKNVKELREVRKDIARIKTLLRQASPL